MIQNKYVQYAIKLNVNLIMVNTKRGLLLKKQTNPKKLCFQINNVKAVETEIRSTNTELLYVKEDGEQLPMNTHDSYWLLERGQRKEQRRHWQVDAVLP